jgi:formylglycine-generating enzyme required for sulfatase activity
MSQPDFTLALANQERGRFESLRAGELKAIRDEPGVANLLLGFQALPEKPPSLTIPALEQRGWKLTQAATDYAVYTQPEWKPAIGIPFHRIAAPGIAPFAICAVEMPLLYASSSRAWQPGAPPEGPQVWANAGGRAAPAPGWTWNAIRQAQTWMRSRPDMASAGEMYPNERSAPTWSTPVTGIPAASASAVAKTLGGSLPTWPQWRAAASFAQQNRLNDAPHLAGSALGAAMQSVAGVEARLKASSWHRSFFDVPGVGNGIWPDTGSYSPARAHPFATGGGGGELWFTPVDREASAAPNRIYDLVGNVAEFVDTENGGFAVVGGSAISSGDWREARAVPANAVFSDVGFRMAVPVAAGADDPLAAFREAVRVAAVTP